MHAADVAHTLTVLRSVSVRVHVAQAPSVSFDFPHGNFLFIYLFFLQADMGSAVRAQWQTGTDSGSLKRLNEVVASDLSRVPIASREFVCDAFCLYLVDWAHVCVCVCPV